MRFRITRMYTICVYCVQFIKLSAYVRVCVEQCVCVWGVGVSFANVVRSDVREHKRAMLHKNYVGVFMIKSKLYMTVIGFEYMLGKHSFKVFCGEYSQHHSNERPSSLFISDVMKVCICNFARIEFPQHRLLKACFRFNSHQNPKSSSTKTLSRKACIQSGHESELSTNIRVCIASHCISSL